MSKVIGFGLLGVALFVTFPHIPTIIRAAQTGFQQKPDEYEHVRYEDKNRKTIDKAEYDREFEKDQSPAECSRNKRTNEVSCAGG